MEAKLAESTDPKSDATAFMFSCQSSCPRASHSSLAAWHRSPASTDLITSPSPSLKRKLEAWGLTGFGELSTVWFDPWAPEMTVDRLSLGLRTAKKALQE